MTITQIIAWVVIVVNTGCIAFSLYWSFKLRRLSRELREHITMLDTSKAECEAMSEAMRLTVERLQMGKVIHLPIVRH